MNRYLIYIVLFVFILAGIITIIFFNGTGDAGDSLQHYLFARYAPNHPELYFHHWAKPVFVLLSSPFAQFGFDGIKVFNLIASAFTIFFTYLTAKSLKIKNALLAAVFVIFSSQFYVLTFSGLTEPLFALFLIAGCYYAVKEKYILSSLIISFLPFVRSEGLILLGVFAVFFIIRKKWKPLLLLGIGHVAYSITGYFVHHDVLWVFSKIPYASIQSKYGSGDLFHYVRKIIYIVGIPLYILLGTGIISMCYRWISKKSKLFSPESILILAGFFAFIIAHSIFWHFGLFDSMGLERVIVGIVPLIAILALYGFNLLTEYLFPGRKWYNVITQSILLLYIFVFPFTKNNAAINWEKDLSLSVDQELIRDVKHYLDSNNINGTRYLYNHPYISMVLNIDCFNPNEYVFLNNSSMNSTNPGDIILWDAWFSKIEGGINENYLTGQDRLQLIKKFESTASGKAYKIHLYKVTQE